MTGAARRWPLWLIAAPAAVAVWSGWVGLGGLCGFGIIHPLPGIVPWLRLDTAITLPVGVEAYGAYALGAWLNRSTTGAARAFARRSALGALLLGMTGQVAYHLLAAAGATRAPWPVVVLVSCMPVVTLGFGSALTHLLGMPAAAPAGVQAAPAALANGHTAPEGGREAAERFAAELARGDLPSIRRVRREMHLGQPRARQVRSYLSALTAAAGAGGHDKEERS